jgi:hypothetical protein
MKIVHFEFLEQGRSLNQHYYMEILSRLREAATTILQSIPEEEFQKCFELCKHDSLSVLVRKETTSKVTATISV